MREAKLCPKCGSGKLDIQTPGVITAETQTLVECQSCGWKGKANELMAYPLDKVAEGLGSGLTDPATAIALEVSTNYMRLLAQHASQNIGLAMIEAGIISSKDGKSLARLLRAACLGAHAATLNELEKIQQEHQDDRGRTPS